jgi:chromatin remodeling complex protein RSC6
MVKEKHKNKSTVSKNSTITFPEDSAAVAIAVKQKKAVKVTKKSKKTEKPVSPIETPELDLETDSFDETIDDVDYLTEDNENNKKLRQTPSRDDIMSMFESLNEMIESEIKRLKDGPVKTKGIKFLRTLNKQLKTLRVHTARVIKQKNKTPRPNNKNSGFQKPVKISQELANFAGWSENELRSRTDVTRYICNYISENNLQNPGDRRQLNLDPKLQKLLGYDPTTSTNPFLYCHIQSCLKNQNHFPKE